MLNPKWDEIVEEINTHAAKNKDYAVKASDFCFLRAPNLFQFQDETDSHPIVLTQHAMSQLLARLKVPSTFYGRCPQHLQEEIFNVFNANRKDIPYLVRMDGNINCRAVMTTRYGVIDDTEVFPVVKEALDGRAEPLQLQKFPDITMLTCVFPDITVHHDGVEYRGGLNIVNSEVGMSALWIEPVVFVGRHMFCNRRALKGSLSTEFRTIHKRSLTSQEISEKVNIAYNACQVGIREVAEAATVQVEMPYLLALIDESPVMPSATSNLLREVIKTKQNMTKLEAAKILDDAVRELPLFRRIQAQQFIGDRVIGLFVTLKDYLNAIKNKD